MTTPLHRAKFIPKSIFLAGCALLAASSLVAQAASGPPIVITISKNQGNATHQTSGGNNGGGGGGKGKGGGTTNTSNSTIGYSIELRNGTASLAKGLTVETHIYVRTANHSNTSSTSNIDDQTDSQTTDVPANGKVVIQTKDVPLTNTTTTIPATQGKGGKGGSPAQTTSSTMTVLGIYVEVSFNGKVIAKKSDPSDDDVQKAKDQMNKANGGGSGTSSF